MEKYKEVFAQLLVKAFEEDSTDDDVLPLLEELDSIWLKFTPDEAEHADAWGKQAILDWKTAHPVPEKSTLNPSHQKRFDELVETAQATTEVEFQISDKQFLALQAIARKKNISVEDLVIKTVEEYLKDKEK
jgi:hypothetical protein